MIGGFDINNFLRTCREVALTTENAFERSAFVPTSDEIGSLTREILNKLTPNSSGLQYKLTLSGAIAEEKKSEKKQSFCSEFNQMMKNIIGLLGFEFSKFLQIHMGTFAFVKIILKDMEDAESYEELRDYTTYIYRVLKPFSKCSYKCAKPKSASKLNTLLASDGVDEFFEKVLSELRQHIASKNIRGFIDNKDELISDIADFIDGILEGNKTIETVNELVFMHMGRYAVVYDDSFLKIFEVLYKSVNADNPNFTDNNPATLKQFTVVEDYIDKDIKLNTKQASNYISALEHYFNDICKITQESLLEDKEIAADVRRMNVNITYSLITLLAKISLCVLTKLALLINTKKDVLMLTAVPSRIQFAQVLEAFMCLPPGVDVRFSLVHLVVIYYVLSCLKVSVVTKQKKKAKEDAK